MSIAMHRKVACKRLEQSKGNCTISHRDGLADLPENN